MTRSLPPGPHGRPPEPASGRPRGRGQSAAHTDVLDARCGFPGSLTLGPPALPPLGATPCHAHGPRKHRAACVCHTPRGAEGGLRRCGQRRCAPSPRSAARLCVRRLACWFQLLESSAFVVAGDYERGGLAAHTCPPLRGSAAQGLAAIYTTSGPWMASGAPSATTVSRAWAARRPSTAAALQGACPRCTRALATGSQNSAGARAAQRPRRLWRSSFPTPDAVSLVQTVAHCRRCGTQGTSLVGPRRP